MTLKPIITCFFGHALFISVLFILWLLELEDVTDKEALYSIPVKSVMSRNKRIPWSPLIHAVLAKV